MHPNALCAHQTAAAIATPHQSTGWATAAERQTQMQKTPAASITSSSSWQSQPTALQLSDFRPAKELFDTMAVDADAAGQEQTLQKPRWPKVQVSDSLRMLLESAAQKQQHDQPPTQAGWQTSGKTPLPSGSAANATPSKIVFNKRVQQVPAPATTAHATAATAHQQGPGAASKAVQAEKRPPTAPLVPALLKRPKFGATAKPPAASSNGLAGSKAAAAQVKAGGTKAPAAAKKKGSAKKAGSADQGTKSKQPNPAAQGANHASPPAASIGNTAAVMPATAHASQPTAALAGYATAGLLQSSAACLPGASTPAPTAAVVPTAPVKAPRQRKKAEDIDLAEVEKKIREKHAANKLSDLSIPEMKCFLKANKLAVGGKKADLIARLEPLLSQT